MSRLSLNIRSTENGFIIEDMSSPMINIVIGQQKTTYCAEYVARERVELAKIVTKLAEAADNKGSDSPKGVAK